MVWAPGTEVPGNGRAPSGRTWENGRLWNQALKRLATFARPSGRTSSRGVAHGISTWDLALASARRAGLFARQGARGLPGGFSPWWAGVPPFLSLPPAGRTKLTTLT
jgi:hypothetical protein